jgi:SAM-dependent methyltransferase
MENIYYSHLESLIPDRSLWVGPMDSVQHFLRWPTEYRIFLQHICGATANSRFLEIGCNHGRTALGLVDLISQEGSYVGYDILKPHIDFANSHFPLVNGRMKFVFADLFNQVYNPAGSIDPLSYIFPSANESIDVAYAASVFTHLLPETIEHYLEETARVLAPGGKAMYSLFILDYYAGVGESAHSLYEFEFPVVGHDGVAAKYHDRPEAVIAYSMEVLVRIARSKGLEIDSVVFGYWSTQHVSASHEQDLVVFHKI